MSVSREEMARRLGVDAHPGGGVELVNRRSFVKLLGASIALAGLDGCTSIPAEHILPYVDQPELTPGVPQYYATSMMLDGYATGLLVESHTGRPTKVEGNPNHPASLGAAGIHEQAAVLQLYDPDRAAQIRHGQDEASWSDIATALAPSELRSRAGDRGAGLLIALEPTSSPLDGELLDRVRSSYPEATVISYAPVLPSDGAIVPQYDLRDADVIVSLDGDLLASGPFHLRYARQFAARRRPESASPGMNRLYAIESSVTVTGTVADHRLTLRPSEIVGALERLLAAVEGRADASQALSETDRWLLAVADDLRAHAGRSVIVAGSRLPARARSLALAINSTLGNLDRTVWYTRSALVGSAEFRGSAALADALDSGQVDTFVCLGANPAYAAPGGVDMPALIRRVRQSVYVGLYENETARACTWMVPAAHFLESWGDARAYDGTLSVIQPLIEPLRGGKTASEVFSLLLGAPKARVYDLVRESWRRRGMGAEGGDFETAWRRVLARGLVEGSAFPRESAPVPELERPVAEPQQAPIEIVFRADARVRDGSFANNAWLQELPDPITTLTWGNAAQLSPATAGRLGVSSGDVVEIHARERSIQIPALVMPGAANDTVTLHFGYGRDGAETVARGVGVNVFPLWPGNGFTATASVSRAENVAREALALTQPHHMLNASEPARSMTIEEYARLPAGAPERAHTPQLYEAPHPQGVAPQQWGMTIDLSACIGCGACMTACQAENNVPAVGRDEVLRGREMHWLRIDWYTGADAERPARISQPMLCQHCERAPCEYVCPVEATVHSSDGLNEMIYNRCIGTRFCSNNCPYKVRRFNWFDYNADVSDLETLGKNPDVTVRDRGVMEKCTFCVQRIRQAEIAARVDGQPLSGDAVRTACQQACPAQAIVFGSITDPASQVANERASARAYAVLDHLGTEPRVLYLARVRNPNPALEAGS